MANFDDIKSRFGALVNYPSANGAIHVAGKPIFRQHASNLRGTFVSVYQRERSNVRSIGGKCGNSADCTSVEIKSKERSQETGGKSKSDQNYMISDKR